MTKSTKNRIVRHLRDQMPNITDAHLNELEKNDFAHDDVVNMLVDNYQCEPHKAEVTAGMVDREKSGQTFTGPSPLPPVSSASTSAQQPMAISAPPQPPQPSFGDKAANFAKKWWVAGALIGLLALLFVTNCRIGVSRIKGASQSDVDTLKKEVDGLKGDHGRIDQLEKGMKGLVGEDGVISTIASDVDRLKQQVGDLEVNKADKSDVDKKLKEKASQSDLDKMKRRLKKIERKLDDHIDAQEEFPPAEMEEPTIEPAKPAGTVTVIVRKVQVD